MSTGALSLLKVYEGWEGHQLALMRAITPLTSDQLTFRPAPHLQTVGELISHISLARLWWFHKMGAPGSAALAHQFAPWTGEKVNTEDPAELRKWTDALEQHEQAIVGNHDELLRSQETTWHMIETTLTQWTVDDLATTYRHLYRGKMYAVSRQWTIWRIMSHDLHHGGELSLMLGMQGIEIPDLGDQGGHLTELPEVEPGG
jgi:uncharacterized damage-inducible protein DinB